MSLDLRMPEPPLGGATTAGALADRLVSAVIDKMAELEQSTAPGLVLPRLYAGHAVLDDASADLLYVLGLLIDCGVDEVGECDLRSRIPPLVSSLDPARVEGFASYRVGETVLRLGGLDALPAKLGGPVLEAVASPEVVARVADTDAMPPNFAVVATRCLRALARLKGDDEPPELPDLLDRVQSIFSSPTGWLNDGMGAWVHYDIYTPDMYLFAEPLADQIGPGWARGLSQILTDLDEVAQPGGAIVWGRSIGALGMAITIELAAIAAGRDLDAPQDRWLARADATLDDLLEWFPGGVIAAHQNRAPMFYRGPGPAPSDDPGHIRQAAAVRPRTAPTAGDSRRSGQRCLPACGAFHPIRRVPAGHGVSYRSKSLSFALPTVFGSLPTTPPRPGVPACSSNRPSAIR